MPSIVRTGEGSVAAAWRALSDVEGWPSLLPTVDSITRLDDRAGMVVGARFEVVQPRLRKAEYVVTDVDAGRSFVWRASSGGVTTVASHSVEADRNGRCRVELSVEFGGPLALVARIGYARLATSYMTQEAAAVLEAAAR